MPGRLLEDVHEQAPVFRIAAPVLIHQVARVVDRAQRARRQALHARRLLVQQERFEDRVRLALEHVVAGDFQHALFLDETVRQHARDAARVREELRLDVLDQDRRELGDRLGGPVIAAHQLFAGALGGGRLVAEALGHRASAGRTRECPGGARRSRAAGRAALSGSLRCGRSSRASRSVIRPRASSSCQLLPKPAAWVIHRISCRSRRPPGLSLMFGSSAYGVS